MAVRPKAKAARVKDDPAAKDIILRVAKPSFCNERHAGRTARISAPVDRSSRGSTASQQVVTTMPNRDVSLRRSLSFAASVHAKMFTPFPATSGRSSRPMDMDGQLRGHMPSRGQNIPQGPRACDGGGPTVGWVRSFFFFDMDGSGLVGSWLASSPSSCCTSRGGREIFLPQVRGEGKEGNESATGPLIKTRRTARDAALAFPPPLSLHRHAFPIRSLLLNP